MFCQDVDISKTNFDFIPSPYNNIPSQENIHMADSPDFGVLLIGIDPPTSVKFSAEIPTYGISKFEWNQNAIALPFGTYTIEVEKDGYFKEKIIIIIERQKNKKIFIALRKIPPLRFIKRWQFTALKSAILPAHLYYAFKYISNDFNSDFNSFVKLSTIWISLPSSPFIIDNLWVKVSKVQNGKNYNKLGSNNRANKSYKNSPNLLRVSGFGKFVDGKKKKNVEIICENGTIWRMTLSGILNDKLNENLISENDDVYILQISLESKYGTIIKFDNEGNKVFEYAVTKKLSSI